MQQTENTRPVREMLVATRFLFLFCLLYLAERVAFLLCHQPGALCFLKLPTHTLHTLLRHGQSALERRHACTFSRRLQPVCPLGLLQKKGGCKGVNHSTCKRGQRVAWQRSREQIKAKIPGALSPSKVVLSSPPCQRSRKPRALGNAIACSSPRVWSRHKYET